MAKRRTKARAKTKARPARKVARRTVRRTVKRTARRPAVKTAASKAVAKPVARKPIGEVTHFFTNIGVAVVKLSDTVKTGDRILIRGATTNFEQNVDSMQVNHVSVEVARPGESIGLKVKDRVREGDAVFRV